MSNEVTVKQQSILPEVQLFELLQRKAMLLANSSIVPDAFKGNVANCGIAVDLAERLGASPLMVAQNMDVIYGRPSWRASFLIATVNNCGRFSSIRYEFFGEPNTDGWGCRAWAIEKSTGEKLVGTDVTIGMAKKEGWYEKKGSKWQSIPQQMLMYRAASWWTRAYAPELSMGLQTVEETRDFVDAEIQADGSYSVASPNQEKEPKKSKLDAFAEKLDEAEEVRKDAFVKINELISRLKKITSEGERLALFLEENGQELFEKAGSLESIAKILSELGVNPIMED